MKNILFACFLCVFIITCKKQPQPFTVGAFQKIYDPSVNEREDWYINDHTFIKGRDGKYHLFGITGTDPKNKTDIHLHIDSSKEKFLAHATSESLLKLPWKKETFPLKAEKLYGESYIWAPYIIKHQDTYYLYYAVGNLQKSKFSALKLVGIVHYISAVKRHQGIVDKSRRRLHLCCT